MRVRVVRQPETQAAAILRRVREKARSNGMLKMVERKLPIVTGKPRRGRQQPVEDRTVKPEEVRP
jgi:hypothetical protein